MRERVLFWSAIAAQVVSTAVALVSSVYALLAFLPFTYHEVIEFPMVSWQPLFLQWNHLFVTAAAGLALFALWRELREARVAAIVAAVAWIALAIALWVNPVLAHPKNQRVYFTWSLLLLAPLLLTALARIVPAVVQLDRRACREEVTRIFQAALVAGALTTLLFRVGGILRHPAGSALPSVWSLEAHLFGFVALFLALVVIRSIAASTPRPIAVEFLLLLAASSAAAAFVVAKVVLAPIGFSGELAHVFAAAAGSVVAATAFSIAAHAAVREGDADNGLDAALAVFPFRRRWSWWVSLAASLVAGAALVLLAARLARFDWNFLFQKLLVLATWSVAFAGGYAMVRAWKRDFASVCFGVAVLFLGVHMGFAKLGAKPANTRLRAELESSVSYDVSFRMLREALAPKPAEDEAAFYRLLQTSTNIPRTVPTPPVDIELASGPATPPAKKPHIFIFVIDSLRRDYLPSYNARVDFAPNLGAFARESVVYRNAFTHYGGTGLSEPSIWTGGLILHKQYVTPYQPMNTLLKLVRRSGYRMYISFDAVLSAIAGKDRDIVQLADGGVSYDYCVSVADLQRRLAADGAQQPIFAYIQPQNLHISTIHRQGETVVTNREYRGFYAPYASRLEVVDRCFGEFITFLKQKGLYDDSIVIVTSDHGDSLGEGGRWGHAYTIYPEIVRVPLLVHVPPSVRQSLRALPDAVTFTTDLTPTLYYLLGYRTTRRDPFFGKPLFTEPTTKPLNDSDRNLLVSSYGPVYGILDNNGTRLFIADALNFKDGFYDVGTGDSVSLGDDLRRDYHDEIRKRVGEVNSFYKFTPR